MAGFWRGSYSWGAAGTCSRCPSHGGEAGARCGVLMTRQGSPSPRPHPHGLSTTQRALPPNAVILGVTISPPDSGGHKLSDHSCLITSFPLSIRASPLSDRFSAHQVNPTMTAHLNQSQSPSPYNGSHPPVIPAAASLTSSPSSPSVPTRSSLPALHIFVVLVCFQIPSRSVRLQIAPELFPSAWNVPF